LTKKREKLADTLYEAILKSIQESKLKEGDRLPGEEALSQQYGVSRPTVREVLARLRAGGLIVSRQGSGSYVGRPANQINIRFPEVESISDIQRYFEFRQGIECGAAEMAARMHDDEDMARIDEAFANLNNAITGGELGLDLDFVLHLSIARASKNKYFVAMLTAIRDQSLFTMTLSRDLSKSNKIERRLKVQEEHQDIVDAIRRRDPAAARIAMETHISRSIDRIFVGNRQP
jgi:GntR family transcriptional regulator, transcriptional repressor for pyruvate dehydrogenase complex